MKFHHMERPAWSWFAQDLSHIFDISVKASPLKNFVMLLLVNSLGFFSLDFFDGMVMIFRVGIKKAANVVVKRLHKHND